MPERMMSVALPLEQWQWVISLLVNSAYIRAKPVVEAIEAQAKKLDEEDRARVSRPQQEAYSAQKNYEAAAAELNAAKYELKERSSEVKILERRINGLKGQLAKQAKRANSHGIGVPLQPAEHALVAELRSDRRTLETQLNEQAAARASAEKLLAKARREWAAAAGHPLPSFPEAVAPSPIEIEAELGDPLDQKDDERTLSDPVSRTLSDVGSDTVTRDGEIADAAGEDAS